MRERPILFSAPMVRAILADTKTQTRRAFRESPPPGVKVAIVNGQTPYGKAGDQLWVRETFCPIYPQDPTYNGGRPIEYDYAATYEHGYRLGDSLGIKKVWKPSIHMPRDASRITLQITSVRVERLQDISEEDALSEGVAYDPGEGGVFHVPGLAGCASDSAVGALRKLWEMINGPTSWHADPWVWVVLFHRIHAEALMWSAT